MKLPVQIAPNTPFVKIQPGGEEEEEEEEEEEKK